MHTTKDLEEPVHQEFKTGVTKDQPNEETPQFPDWFQRPKKLPSPDRDWNKTLPECSWTCSTLAKLFGPEGRIRRESDKVAAGHTS
ncbi:hypothetical protein Tco_1209606 [Tanacetum coccineum]